MSRQILRKYISAAALVAAAALTGGGCSGNKEKPVADGSAPVAQVGSEILTTAQLGSMVPAGLAPADSARYARAVMAEWIDSRLIASMAREEMDMTEIDRMVDDYRNQLILAEYRRQMFAGHADSIPDDSLRQLYLIRKTDYVLQRPMVKGVYLKVPDDSQNLAAIKRLYHSEREADRDRLEKEITTSAIHYDYFRDRWIDWEQVENRIPYDFGNPDAWLRGNKSLDKSLGGFTYLLYITEVLPSGSPMPFEAAKPLLKQRMLASQRQVYDARLFEDLRARALDKGTLKIFESQ